MRRLLAVVIVLAGRAAAAQPIVLSIRPHAGDTLHMRYDQRVETVAETKRGHVDTTTSVVSTLLVLSRTIVESSDSTGADLVAVTDSVAATSTGGRMPESAEDARRMLQGKLVHLHVSPDGATVDEDSTSSPELRAAFAAVPAILPRQPTPVGRKWKREMAGPVAGERGHGEVKATFRLDSLSRSGEVAHVSFEGTTSQVADGVSPTGGKAHGETSGTVTGTVLLDLRRGWMTEWRATITVTSTVKARDARMKIKMTVTQWLRAID
jgi:hypothetical protein